MLKNIAKLEGLHKLRGIDNTDIVLSVIRVQNGVEYMHDSDYEWIQKFMVDCIKCN